MNLASALNSAWMWKCGGQSWAFHRATRGVAKTQARILQQTLARNRGTVYGARYGFDTIRSPREFQQRVPLSDYTDYAGLIDRIAAGEANVLTRENVRLLEPTSGTTRGEKLIPYTPSLRRQFQRAIAAWIADLMRYRPAVRQGRAYWSISPALGPARKTASGIPIGFDDDTAYLGRLERRLVDRLLAVPAAVAKASEIDNFRYCTLLHLVRAKDLSLISVWNPTFLTALLEPLNDWGDRICFDLCRGQLSLPRPGDSHLSATLTQPTATDDRRADELRSILHGKGALSEQLQQVWPHLALISCWTDAAAAAYVGQLRALFPSIEIQPKGLLATEGCVSFPLVGNPGPALAVRCHFFEFIPVDMGGAVNEMSGNCLLAHELSLGGKYEIVLTTAGGLYRYRLHDIVEVVGFDRECPLLKFLGKSDKFSDLVGEKLCELHVREVLDRAFAAHRIRPSFAIVVPVLESTPRYRLYLQGNGLAASGQLSASLAATVQTALEENPYYRQAVELRQLDSLEVHVLDASAEAGQRVYERGCQERGQKLGNIKPAALDSWTGWPTRFSRSLQDA
jgi:hypothetical protein